MQILTFHDAYNITFKVLEEYYTKSVEGDLANLLSDMSTKTFSDAESADPAAYEDWLDIAKARVDNECIQENQIILVAVDYIKWYMDEFGYELENVLQFFTHDPGIMMVFQNAIISYYEERTRNNKV